jgi:hypothetical protein
VPDRLWSFDLVKCMPSGASMSAGCCGEVGKCLAFNPSVISRCECVVDSIGDVAQSGSILSVIGLEQS